MVLQETSIIKSYSPSARTNALEMQVTIFHTPLFRDAHTKHLKTRKKNYVSYTLTVADPGENLTGALHSNFEHSGCGGHG